MAGYASEVVSYGYARRSQLRPLFFHIAVACVLLFGVARAVVAYQPVEAAAYNTSAPHSSAGGSALSVPACRPNTSYALPLAVDLGNTASGLTEVIDQPALYHVYGVTVAQVTQELNECAPHFNGKAPGSNNLAYTSYRMDWQYYSLTSPGGQCVLSGVKVGLHVSQIFPQWDSAGVASAAMNAKWQSFMAGLTYHESGHVALNTAYANKLLADLQALPPMDCQAVAREVALVANTDIVALNAAHLQHDKSTDYGATEGAVWR